jgi:hypothetical protein
MELTNIEAVQILKGIELAAIQLQTLAKEVGSHDQQFTEVQAQLNQIKLDLALLTASKSRSDLSIAVLPDYFKKTDAVYDGFKRMESKIDGIIVQAWGGFLAAIAISGITLFFTSQRPVKAELLNPTDTQKILCLSKLNRS